MKIPVWDDSAYEELVPLDQVISKGPSACYKACLFIKQSNNLEFFPYIDIFKNSMINFAPANTGEDYNIRNLLLKFALKIENKSCDLTRKVICRPIGLTYSVQSGIDYRTSMTLFNKTAIQYAMEIDLLNVFSEKFSVESYMRNVHNGLFAEYKELLSITTG